MGRILVAEDDAALARGLVALFEQSGYDVESVATGHAALARQAAGTYAVIVLDLGLPDLSGFEVLKQLRSRERRGHGDAARCPVLVLTARSALNDRVRGLDLGADDYLLKPFEPPELLARVRALLRRVRSKSADSRSNAPTGHFVSTTSCWSCRGGSEPFWRS
jgi:two-component system OmpR family response regulator